MSLLSLWLTEYLTSDKKEVRCAAKDWWLFVQNLTSVVATVLMGEILKFGKSFFFVWNRWYVFRIKEYWMIKEISIFVDILQFIANESFDQKAFIWDNNKT